MGYNMKLNDKILDEYEKDPIKCQKWADRRVFYLTYIWPVLHPIQNYRLKKFSTPSDEMLKQIKTRLHEKELLQKYEHLTNEQHLIEFINYLRIQTHNFL